MITGSNRKRLKLGFTLIEVMTTIAILTVLFTIVGVSYVSVKESINQTKVDSIARQMYVAAQENLTKIITSGNESILERGISLEEKFWPEDGYSGNNIKYTSSNYYKYETSSSSSSNGKKFNLLKSLLPEDTFEDGETRNTYIIEYDPDTGMIVGVFYTEALNNTDDNTSFYRKSTTNNLRKNATNRKNFAKKNFKGVLIGYYGAGATDEATNGRDVYELETIVDIRNSDDLTVTIGVNKGDYASQNITTEYTFTGVTSGAQYKPNAISFTTNIPNTVEIVLDSLNDSSKYFENQYSGFIPGEDIRISAVSYVTSNPDIKSATIVKKTNSYYESIEDTKITSITGNNAQGYPYQSAYIGNTRHLRNLGKIASGTTAKISIVAAYQTRDIVVPSGYKFPGITNADLYYYHGNSHSIRNLTVYSSATGNANLGLFSTFGTKLKEYGSVNYLTLIDASIVNDANYTNTNVGFIMGTTANKCKIKNCGVYLTDNYAGYNENPADHIKAEGTYVGGLAGKNAHVLQIENSYASTITKGLVYCGGLVGNSSSTLTITKCYSSSYLTGNIVGGLIGNGSNYQIKSSYASGILFNVDKVEKAAGLANGAANIVNNSYTIFDVRGALVSSYSTVPSAKQGSKVYYAECNNEATHATGITTTEVKDEDLINPDFVSESLSLADFQANPATANCHPYNYNSFRLTKYPYPILKITGSSSSTLIDHYGDWTVDDTSANDCGFLYWEKEVDKNGSSSYHYYMIYTDDDESVYQNLCHSHDCEGVITEYGYGYIIKSAKYDALTSVDWDDNTVATHRESGSSNDFINANINDDACDGIANLLRDQQGVSDGMYVIHCYKTADSSVSDVRTTGDLYLTGILKLTDDLTLLKSTHTTVTINPKGSRMYYAYSFCPYFAQDFSVSSGRWEVIQNILSDYIRYKAVYQSYNSRAHKIRSIDQLQYLNYNYDSYNCHTLADIDNCIFYPFLLRFSLLTSGFNFQTANYEQTHDIDATNYNNYTPIAGTEFLLSSAERLSLSAIANPFNGFTRPSLFLLTWFGGGYDGNTYQIKNLHMSTKSNLVGMFGGTIGARLENILLTSTDSSKSYIERVNSNKDSYTDYYMGGLVGLACQSSGSTLFKLLNWLDSDSKTWSTTIDNCAIGGYNIIDRSDNATTITGSSSVGGLIGATNVKITNCSAVTDIAIHNQSKYGTVFIGGLVGNCSAGSNELLALGIEIVNPGTKTDLVSIHDCYTGGRIHFEDGAEKCTTDNGSAFASMLTGGKYFKGYYVGGIVASNNNISISQIIDLNSSYTNTLTVFDCYSYMELPKASDKNADNIYAIGKIYAANAAAGLGYSFNNMKASAVFNWINFNELYNCYYYDDGDVKLVKNNENMIEYESYFGDSEIGILKTRTICRYDNGKEKGVKDCTYNDLAQLNDSYTYYTYNGSNKPDKYSSTGSNQYSYPFRSVVSRGSGRIHVGYWPAATKVELMHTQIGNKKIVGYIADGENLSEFESYLASKITPVGWVNEGYYSNNEMIVRSNGKFATNHGYYKGASGKETWSYNATKGISSNSLSYITADAKLVGKVTLHTPYFKSGTTGVTGNTYSYNVNIGDTITVPDVVNKTGPKDADTTKNISSSTFLGWYVAVRNSSNEITDMKQVIDGNNDVVGNLQFNNEGQLDLYAGWKCKYNVVYSGTNSTTLTSGNKYLIVYYDNTGLYRMDVNTDTLDSYWSTGNRNIYYLNPVKVDAKVKIENSVITGMIIDNTITPWTYTSKKYLEYGNYGYLAYSGARRSMCASYDAGTIFEVSKSGSRLEMKAGLITYKLTGTSTTISRSTGSGNEVYLFIQETGKELVTYDY